ncbi:MAG: hypothetical protein AAGM67_15040, partial [Bacteroidota bacterium]
MNDDELTQLQSAQGYTRSVIGGLNQQSIGRQGLTEATIRVLRFLLHGLLSVSIGVTSQQANVVQILSSNDANTAHLDAEGAARHLWEKSDEDWEKLKQVFSVNDSELALLFHRILRTYQNRPNLSCPETFTSVDQRSQWELQFQREIIDPITQDALVNAEEELELIERRLSSSGPSVLEESELKEDLLEQSADPSPESLLWRFRKPISLEDFSARFYRLASNERDFPIVDLVLKEGKEISVIRHLPAILQWHSILFEIYPDGALSREEAMEITNREAIENLPASRRGVAQRVFREYCEAFNASFCFLENLYECNENPYKQMEMGPET